MANHRSGCNLFMSTSEYFSLTERHELINGEIVPVAPETETHNQLVQHIKTLLDTDSGLRRCTVFSTNTKIEVIPESCYLYADIAVTCNVLEFRNTNGLMRQPRILVEVSSAATVEQDRATRWGLFQQIPSLQYFLLVDEGAKSVELFTRDEGTRQWHSTSYHSDADLIELPRFEMAIPLKSMFIFEQ